MSTAPSSPAEMQALIVERLKDRGDDNSELGASCDSVFKSLASSLAVHCPKLLDDAVELGALDWVPQHWSDLSASIGETGFLLVIGAEEHEPAGFASVDAAAGSILFGAALGADQSGEIMALTSPLSNMEKGILKIAGLPFALAINESDIVNTQFDVVDALSQQDVQQISPQKTDLIHFRFELKFGPLNGNIGIHVPAELLSGNEDSVTAENDNLSKWDNDLRDGVLQTTVGVSATIALEPSTLGDLNELLIGDILEFPVDRPNTAVLSARNKTLFIGQFGRVGNRYSVRVERPNQPKSDLVEHIMSSI